MANSIVKLSVDDSSYNAKIKAAAQAFADFGRRVSSAGIEAFGDFAKGAKTAKVAFQGFNAALKANVLVLIASLAVEAGQALGEMIGNWIRGANDAEDAQRSLNSELEKTSLLLKEMNSSSKFNERLARAAGASTTEIIEQRIKDAEKMLDEASVRASNISRNKNATLDQINAANKMVADAQENLRKARQDWLVDNTAKQHRTGEYAIRGGGGGGGRRGGRGGSTPKPTYVPEAGTPDFVNAMISDLQKKVGRTANSGIREGLLMDIKALQAEYKSMTTLPSIAEIIDIDEFEQALSPLQQLNQELKTLREELETSPNTEEYQSKLQEIADKEKEIKKFKGESDTADVAKESSNSWQQAASSITAVGSALKELEDPGAKIAGIIGQAIANIALGFSQATAAASGGGPFAWIAAIAGGLGTMVSTIAAIHSATGYAEGGIVKGTTYSGDKIPAMLNAGEVVLSRAQTNNLASSLNSTGFQNMRLEAVVSGTQLRFVLNNESQVRGRGQYVTTNFNG